MLICERCQRELKGGTFICRDCGYNNALRRVDNWRERRRPPAPPSGADGQPRQSKPGRGAQAARLSPRRASHDSTLIPFPTAARTPAGGRQQKPDERQSEGKNETYPPWRQGLSERVRQIRERRAARPDEQRAADAECDRNPIIESALRRIQRAEYLPPISAVRPSRVSGAAAVRVAEPAAAPEEAPADEPVRNVSVRPTVVPPSAPPVEPLPTAKGLQQAEVTARTRVEQPPVEATQAELPRVGAPPDEASQVRTTPAAAPTPESAAERHDLEDVPMPDWRASERVIFTAGPKPVCVPAPLRQRAAAALIDAEAAVFGALVVFAAFMLTDATLGEAASRALAVTATLLIPLYFAASFIFAGRTFGMALLKLHTGSPTGAEVVISAGVSTKYEIAPLSLRDAAARAVGGAASLLLFPLNLYSILRSDDQLSLSDRLSETRVVCLARKHE
jgi:hypothetical protein